MRLAVICSRPPGAFGEPYLGVELKALKPHVSYLVVEPVRPAWSLRTIACAVALLVTAPMRCLQALIDVARGSGSVLVKLKNLVIFPRALALAWDCRRQRIEHVHAYWLSVPATAAFVISRVNRIPFSLTAHRWDISEKNMTAEKACRASFVRAISERGRAELRRLVPQHAEKISVVRLGTALDKWAPLPQSRREFRILCAAAFVPVKGHRLLLQAFARAHAALPHLQLTLCGRGPLEGALRAQAGALPCRNAIIFRGYVPHERLLRELQAGQYDAVVLASIDDGATLMEGVPSILIEAASAGVPCIATRSGAVGELLDDRSAFLVPPQDVPALARAILEATHAGERGLRAQRAAERTRRLHDPSRTAAQIAGLIAGADGGAA